MYCMPENWPPDLGWHFQLHLLTTFFIMVAFKRINPGFISEVVCIQKNNCVQTVDK